MNKKRTKSIFEIARLFLNGTDHKEWDVRISLDEDYHRPMLQLLADGGNPDFDDHWYTLLVVRSSNRLRLNFPKTLKARNIAVEVLKQKYKAKMTYTKGASDMEWSCIEVRDRFECGIVLSSYDNSYIFDNGTFRTNSWEWAVDGDFESSYYGQSQFSDFVQNNIDHSVICRFIAYRQNEHEFSKTINYLGVSAQDPSKLSYLTKDRWDKCPRNVVEDIYDGSRRFHTKPAKGIRKLFLNPERFTPQDYEIFTRRWNLAFNPNSGFKMRLIHKSDIPSYYSGNHHHDSVSGGSTLGGSCMRSSDRSYFQIYAENCDGMLVLSDDDDKYLGRALVWTMDCGTKIMDRIYYGTEDVCETFKKYAKDNGLTRKRNQSHSDRVTWVDSLGECFDKVYTKTLKSYDYDYYPYVDTFSFKEYDGDTLSNSPDSMYNGVQTLTSLDGSYEEDDSRSCEICNDRYSEDDDRYCETEGISTCDGCSSWSEIEQDNISDNASFEDHHSGDRIFSENAVYSNFHCHYIHTDECNDDYKEVDDDWIEESNLVYSEHQGEYLMTANATCIETPDGNTDWIAEDDAVWSDSLDKHIIQDEAQQDKNDDWVYEIDDEEEENEQDETN